jgi:hypothetical protein
MGSSPIFEIQSSSGSPIAPLSKLSWKGPDMNEYVFEVKLRAVVRVRASDEGVAREVVSSVLGAPGSVEINLANENNAARLGQRATVTNVDFMQKTGPRLLKDDVARPQTGSPLA